MKRITTLFVVALLATTSIFAQYVLSFDSTSAKAAFAFTTSKNSEFPHHFRIINEGNYNMYRVFAAAEGDNGPILADYDGFEVEFDYPTVWDIPAGLQFFFSTDGFGRGYYPAISTIIGESTKLTINFADYPNLFVDAEGAPVADTKRFNRFGYRNAGLRLEDSSDPADYTMDVKIKNSALIKKDGTKEYFNYAGGGMWDAGHSYRLYGPTAKFTLGAEGYVAWNLSSKEVKYINIYLAEALTADIAASLTFEYADFMAVDAALVTGLTEGSRFISIDARTLTVGNFSFFNETGSIELSVSRIELSESGEPTSVKNVSVNEVMPEFVNVYTIQGQLVRQKVAYSQALVNLPKGVYIVHNKKVAVVK
jgi:hypothetical protein